MSHDRECLLNGLPIRMAEFGVRLQSGIPPEVRAAFAREFPVKYRLELVD